MRETNESARATGFTTYMKHYSPRYRPPWPDDRDCPFTFMQMAVFYQGGYVCEKITEDTFILAVRD